VHTLRAQPLVRVLDESGAALASAQVELWSPTALLAHRTTNAAGLAQFLAADVSRAKAIVVRSVGFLPAREKVAPELDSLVIRLESLQGRLATVVVHSTRRTCPQTDDETARRLWEAAAKHYRTPSVEGRRADVESRRTVVREAEIGNFADQAPGAGWRSYTHWGMLGARNALARHGYVTPLTGTHTYDDFGIWRYLPLHAELAGQFVDSLFGDHHTFSIVSSARTTVLLFCARDRRRPGLDGTVRLDSDGALLDSRWMFWNPRRDAEPAGGEVVFAPPSSDGHTPLFSASGLFWRRLRSGGYLQRWEGYSSWELLPDSVGARRMPAVRTP
jgi:hypothetical protein